MNRQENIKNNNNSFCCCCREGKDNSMEYIFHFKNRQTSKCWNLNGATMGMRNGSGDCEVRLLFLFMKKKINKIKMILWWWCDDEISFLTNFWRIFFFYIHDLTCVLLCCVFNLVRIFFMDVKPFIHFEK